MKLATSCAVGCLVLVAAAGAAEEAHLMRWADVHGDRNVFTYEDDLWTVPGAGGDARRLTSHPGAERYAKFSPDGSQIAFTGSYDGGTITPPQFGSFAVDGSEWLIEGQGVVPDIDVENLPRDVLAGRDPQLETAVRHLLERLADDPRALPPPPPFPDKSKPGEGRPSSALQFPRPTG